MIWDVFLGQKAELVTSLLREHKISNKYVPKKYDQLFSGARSHRKQMSKGIYETKTEQMVRNAVKKWIENITIMFLLSTIKLLHVGWLIKSYNQLTLSHGRFF